MTAASYEPTPAESKRAASERARLVRGWVRTRRELESMAWRKFHREATLADRLTGYRIRSGMDHDNGVFWILFYVGEHRLGNYRDLAYYEATPRGLVSIPPQARS